MISEDFDQKWRTSQVMFPCFQSPNNCKEFSVVDVVISFSGGE